MAKLTFLGAARTVTGSKYLLEHNGQKVLFDCGLFQGLKDLRLRNWDEFPVPPASLNAVVLTHAHLDHVGYLPRLVAQGYRGRVFCTPGTKDFAQVVLPDAGRIQEEDARQANKHGYSKHDPALPLFTESDALRALTQLQPLGYERPIEVVPGISIEFHPAGHLLGSAFIIVRLTGGPTHPVRWRSRTLQPAGAAAIHLMRLQLTSCWSNPPMAIEITRQTIRARQLAEVIKRHGGQRGKLVIPAFAIGRVEELLYWMRRLEQRAPHSRCCPVYVDSPMATEALTVLLCSAWRNWIPDCGRPRGTYRRSPRRVSRRSHRRSSRRSSRRAAARRS